MFSWRLGVEEGRYQHLLARILALRVGTVSPSVVLIRHVPAVSWSADLDRGVVEEEPRGSAVVQRDHGCRQLERSHIKPLQTSPLTLHLLQLAVILIVGEVDTAGLVFVQQLVYSVLNDVVVGVVHFYLKA